MTTEWRIEEVDNGGWGIEFEVQFRSGGDWVPGKVFRHREDAAKFVAKVTK